MTGAGSALSEFLPPYLAEAEELLASARKLLLAAEASARQGSAHPRAVRDLFRAVHTIKGLSAMVEVEPVVTIAHLMETTLRRADRGGGKLAPDAIEPLVQGLAAIEQRVRALGEGRVPGPPPARLLERLEALAAFAGGPAREEHDQTPLALDAVLLGKLAPSDHEQLRQGLRAGQRAVRLDFRPSSQRAAAGLNITSVRERLARVAEIVKVLPLSAPASETQPGGLVFALLVLTRQPDPVLVEAAGIEPADLQRVAEGGATPPADAERESFGEDEDERVGELSGPAVVRVQASRLDDAMDGIAAMVVNRARLVRAVKALTESGANTRELTQVLHENARMLRDLRGAIVKLRMVRVSEVLDRLALMVRGLRRTTGKLVAVALDVGQAELDKAVGDRLFPAIVHLVRNAVDHAIEDPETRRALGKPVESVLRVSCHERSNGQLELTISDDGRGIDSEAVARRAGAPVPTDDAALLDLLCRPGLSTRDQVTTTSGRGMGMDIVKRIAVDQLGGLLTLRTERGKGTTFTLRVPLTISIVDAFVFEAGEQRFAAAVSTIEELFEVDASALTGAPSPGARARVMGMLQRRGAPVPLLSLASVLKLGAEGSRQKAMLIQLRGQPMAFAVDRMLSQQEIVVRPLEDPLIRRRGIAGATDLGDGTPTLVLDLLALGAREAHA